MHGEPEEAARPDPRFGRLRPLSGEAGRSGPPGAAWGAGGPAGTAAARYRRTAEILRTGGTPFAALRAARESQGLAVADLAARLEVRPWYLEVLEDGHPERLPGPGYARGLVWRLAVQLDLDPDLMVEEAHLPAFFDVDCLLGSRRLGESVSADQGRRALPAALVVTAALVVGALALLLFLR
ncbi:MAG: hypothetical protein Kow00122_03520 [Thermoleophilia bacterium]